MNRLEPCIFKALPPPRVGLINSIYTNNYWNTFYQKCHQFLCLWKDEAILGQLAGIGKVGQEAERHTGNETEAGEDERC